MRSTALANRHFIALVLACCSAHASAAATLDFAAAAQNLDAQVTQFYAYLEKLPDGALPRSAILDAKRAAVRDEDSLLRYAEDRLMSLADHHAITGSAFADSWAVVPTYADLWIVRHDNAFWIDAVREGSPSELSGVKAGGRLIAVDGVPIGDAVEDFWTRLGLAVTPQRAEYTARVLAAGRRDRNRKLTIVEQSGNVRQLTLVSLYQLSPDQPPLTVTSHGGCTIVRLNNSLGNDLTISAFDAAMQRLPSTEALVIDLRDTPSGGNTTIARAVMGWFVASAKSYQIHNRPVEERDTGIARQWIEQVLPRRPAPKAVLPTVWVGRWTGSMGEGLAIGFAALGAEVRGTRMAGLNGSVEELPIGPTRLTVKIPTERLMTVEGLPRENYQPKAQPLACLPLNRR